MFKNFIHKTFDFFNSGSNRSVIVVCFLMSLLFWFLIKSNVLDFVGAPLPGKKVGMQGGIIIIEGNVNDYLGLNMRRGIITVDC